jgi:hypothetical protein
MIGSSETSKVFAKFTKFDGVFKEYQKDIPELTIDDSSRKTLRKF